MSLKEYKEKRNFGKTAEPDESRLKKKTDGLVYIIQRHQASHLHYDLRLEENGVLKSWAVPKEPPLKEGIKRLAVQTEDHPLGCEDFEGIIPEGQYGAGKVKIWDKGIHLPIEATAEKRVVEIMGRNFKVNTALLSLKVKIQMIRIGFFSSSKI